jgi:hypothetical protein
VPRQPRVECQPPSSPAVAALRAHWDANREKYGASYLGPPVPHEMRMEALLADDAGYFAAAYERHRVDIGLEEERARAKRREDARGWFRALLLPRSR